jgi:hypothetical protein
MKYTDPTGMMDEETVVAKIVDNINKSKGDVLVGVMSSINELKTESFTVSKDTLIKALKKQNVEIPSEYTSVVDNLQSISYTGSPDGKNGNLEVNFKTNVKFTAVVDISAPKKVSYDFSFEGDNIVAQPHPRETAITGLGIKVNELKFTGDSLSIKVGIVRTMIWKKDK